MAELFETYEREFCDLSGTITCDLNDLQTMGTTSGKVKALDAKFSTLQESLRNMEIELASLPESKKAQLNVRLRNFQANANNLRKEFDKAKLAAGRKELVGKSSGVRFISAEDEEHRNRMQTTTERLANQNETLQNARRLVGDMEDLGEDTKGRLRVQREGLERTLNTLRETGQEVSRSRKLLHLINRRSCMSKLIIFAVILVLITVIVLVIYFAWIAPLFRSKPELPPPPKLYPNHSPLPDYNDSDDAQPGRRVRIPRA